MTAPAIVQAAGLLLFTMDSQQHRPAQFLLMRHRDRWDLPKGLREPGESLIITALRETEEETGIDAAHIQIVNGFSFALEYEASYSTPRPVAFRKRATYFLGLLSYPVEIQCTEHSGYQWFCWSPPHKIQSQTIDPLLAAAEQYFDSLENSTVPTI